MPRLAGLKIAYDTTKLMLPHVHGRHSKDLIVLHETVSPDIVGLDDIKNVELFLAQKNYGIHGMTDAEGNIAWAYGLGNAVFWQCGGVNERSIGIEQVSNVMLRSPLDSVRSHIWALRQKELRATARLLASISTVHEIPLRYTDGRSPGVTTHWSVSQWSPSSEGHTDCFPTHLGGYYPALEVIRLAKLYKLGL